MLGLDGDAVYIGLLVLGDPKWSSSAVVVNLNRLVGGVQGSSVSLELHSLRWESVRLKARRVGVAKDMVRALGRGYNGQWVAMGNVQWEQHPEFHS